MTLPGAQEQWPRRGHPKKNRRQGNPKPALADSSVLGAVLLCSPALLPVHSAMSFGYSNIPVAISIHILTELN